MNLLLAHAENDQQIHIMRSTEDARWALHRYADAHTLCGLEVTEVSDVDEHGPVSTSLACTSCADQLGQHDHIPLVEDEVCEP